MWSSELISTYNGLAEILNLTDSHFQLDTIAIREPFFLQQNNLSGVMHFIRYSLAVQKTILFHTLKITMSDYVYIERKNPTSAAHFDKPVIEYSNVNQILDETSNNISLPQRDRKKFFGRNFNFIVFALHNILGNENVGNKSKFHIRKSSKCLLNLSTKWWHL